MQALAAAHDTPDRLRFVEPVGFGVAWIFQLVPTDTSAKVVAFSAGLVNDPTPTHQPAAVQAMALRPRRG
jgi:hypothetical protein